MPRGEKFSISCFEISAVSLINYLTRPINSSQNFCVSLFKVGRAVSSGKKTHFGFDLSQFVGPSSIDTKALRRNQLSGLDGYKYFHSNIHTAIYCQEIPGRKKFGV